MEQIELRNINSCLTVNSQDELLIEGLVNETNTWSQILGKHKKFREKIGPGVFSRAIEKASRIDFLGEHNQNLLLATTENGSLELWEDQQGLKMRATVIPTSYGKDLHTLIKNKLVNHMSFGFKVVRDSWKRGVDGIFERTIEEMELKEVSAVRNPVYKASAIAARGLELVEEVTIPDEVLEIETRSEIDLESIKNQIKQELLEEMAKKADEEKKEPVVPKEEPVVEPEVKIEEPKVIEEPKENKTVDTKDVETEVSPGVVEDNSAAKVEVVEDKQKPNMAEVFNKFKEIQKLK